MIIKKNLKTCKKFKKFYLTDKYISRIIDEYRSNFYKKYLSNNQKNKKIIHVTNFNIRHNARLFYNTGRRINNGLIRNLNSVVTLSDRDIISYEKTIKDITGSKALNNKLLEITSNYNPDLITFGHTNNFII